MKRLLVLGGNYTEFVIVKRAKALGVYTIVTDNHTDWSLSPAKQIADEAWNISWSDIDALYRKCSETEVDGVLAGFSEFRVENMIKLCSLLNLPCSLTMDQLNITRDKKKFKQLCSQFGLECVHEYSIDGACDFPVIVKPVDRAGSIGINVANNIAELRQHYELAMSLSPSKNVIIEDFITDGIKVDVYYYVHDKTITFLGSSDTIMCEGTEGARILQKGWVYSSHFEKLYIETADFKVREMLRFLNLKNCYVTMSAFCEEDKFLFFEAGFRLSGEFSFDYYQSLTGVNYLDCIIQYSLGDNSVSRTFVDANDLCPLYAVTLNYFCKDGHIACITPEESLNSIPNTKAYIYVKAGDDVSNPTAVYKKAIMCTLVEKDRSKLKELVRKVNQTVTIQTEDFRNLIYEKVDENSIGFIGRHIYNECVLMPRPYYVTYGQIQKLLNISHETNIAKGLHYATYNQPVDKLIEKLKNSVCFVILKGGHLAATASIQFRNIDYWYHSGPIGLLKLLAVDPIFRGKHFAKLLVEEIISCAKQNKINVVVSDSAEKNKAIHDLYLKCGFKQVDCCKYPSNNFFSTVYAKWLDACPWSNVHIKFKYVLRRLQVHRKNKPM